MTTDTPELLIEIERTKAAIAAIETRYTDALVKLDRLTDKFDDLYQRLHDICADPRLATREEIVAYIRREMLGVG